MFLYYEAKNSAVFSTKATDIFSLESMRPFA